MDRRDYTTGSIVMTGILLLLAIALMPAAGSAADNAACLMCHSAVSLEKVLDGKRVQLYVNPAAFSRSVHGKLSCIDCHADLKGRPMPHKADLAPAVCAGCHKDNHDVIHAALRSPSEKPACQDCHGSHYIASVSHEDSPVSSLRSEGTCLRCHAESEAMKVFTRSVHAQAKDRSGARNASCTDCHSAHKGYTSTSPNACAGCHKEEARDFAVSSHGHALMSGLKAAPSCVACHGGHDITPPSDATSKVFPANVPKLCAGCHDDPMMHREFGLPTDRLKTYRASYHGIALEHGDLDAATCASCHGSHRILPQSDPESTIHKSNLQETCGNCHPGVGPLVAKGAVHSAPSPRKEKPAYWINTIYGFFVAAMMLAFCGYMALELFTHWRLKRGGRR